MMFFYVCISCFFQHAQQIPYVYLYVEVVGISWMSMA